MRPWILVDLGVARTMRVRTTKTRRADKQRRSLAMLRRGCAVSSRWCWRGTDGDARIALLRVSGQAHAGGDRPGQRDQRSEETDGCEVGQADDQTARPSHSGTQLVASEAVMAKR